MHLMNKIRLRSPGFFFKYGLLGGISPAISQTGLILPSRGAASINAAH